MSNLGLQEGLGASTSVLLTIIYLW